MRRGARQRLSLVDPVILFDVGTLPVWLGLLAIAGTGCAVEQARSNGERIRRAATSLSATAVYLGRIRGFPRASQWTFSGDGRLILATTVDWDGNGDKNPGQFALVFRPEAQSIDTNGTPQFSSSFTVARGEAPELSSATRIELSRPASNITFITDPEVRGRNPTRTDSSCNAASGGAYHCYKIVVYQTIAGTSGPGSETLGYFKARVVVADPLTPRARVAANGWQQMSQPRQLIDTAGKPIRGIEPSVTADGRLLVYHARTTKGSTRPYYSWNQRPNRSNGWRVPQPIANMYWVDRNVLVAGVPFAQRYPIARQPLRDPEGKRFARDQIIRGAYPWISLSGETLTHSTARLRTPGPLCCTFRTGFAVVGPQTGWAYRHIDGPINADRWTEGNHFVASPGGLPSLWPPFPGVSDAALPYLPERPVLPLFATTSRVYQEVSFAAPSDGHYEVFLEMNEIPDMHAVDAEFVVAGQPGHAVSKTADISGHFNTALLEQGAAFPVEATGRDEALAGAKGQAIYFERDARLRVPHSPAWQLSRDISVNIWVKPLVDLSHPSDNNYLYLARKRGAFEFILLEDRRVRARVYQRGTALTAVSRQAIPLKRWSAVGMSYDAVAGTLTIYIDGVIVKTLDGTPNAGIDATLDDLLIGPAGMNKASSMPTGRPIVMLDEFSLSRVARTPLEMMRLAHRRPAVDLPLGLDVADLRHEAPRQANDPEVALGRRLFFDKRLSGNGQVACSSCHTPNRAFSDGEPTPSAGINPPAITRNTPMVVNRIFAMQQMWDGRAPSLEAQYRLPLIDPNEMGMASVGAAMTVLRDPASGYDLDFRALYGTVASQHNLGRALAAYQYSLVSGNSRVDRHDAGEQPSPLTAAELRGRALFYGQGRCVACHNGSNYTDERYHNTGMAQDAADEGRQRQTASPYDRGAFKTPSLREAAATAPYLHDGSAVSLSEVVARYNRGGTRPPRPGQDAEIQPLGLSGRQVRDLAAFVAALSGTTLAQDAPTDPDAGQDAQTDSTDAGTESTDARATVRDSGSSRDDGGIGPAIDSVNPADSTAPPGPVATGDAADTWAAGLAGDTSSPGGGGCALQAASGSVWELAWVWMIAVVAIGYWRRGKKESSYGSPPRLRCLDRATSTAALSCGP